MRLPSFPLRSARLLGLAVLVSAAAAQAAPLPLLGDRFHVEASWRTAAGQTGVGTPVSLTGETGYFWFFSPTNVEVVVKVLDACTASVPRFWVFAGGLTDVFVTLEVTDNATGEKKVYTNPQGTPYRPIQDTNAFATCGVRRCGQGSFAELAATPRADTDLEALALLIQNDSVTASTAVYQRVLADVAAIRSSAPALAGVPFNPYVSPDTLLLSFHPSTLPAVLGGSYRDWDCLNAWYGVNHVSIDSSNQVRLSFGKVLDTRRIAADYRALLGVTAVDLLTFDPFPITLPPPNDSFCGRSQGNLFHYYVRSRTLGYLYFTSLPGSAPVSVGLSPAWYQDAQDCFSEHVSYF